MRFARGLAGFVVVPLLLACGRHAPEPSSSTPRERAQVRIESARRVQGAATREVVGTVRPRTSATLSPSVMGTISELKVSLGSRVRAGEVLVRLRAGEIDAKARQAAAAYAQAGLELRRAKALRQHDVVSQAEVDTLDTQYRIAEGAQSEARVMQSYTVIRAPFAGVVTAKLANAGDLAVPGHPILGLEDPGALRLEATVPEALSVGLVPGEKRPVHVEAAGAELEGSVVEVSPSADPATRTVLVKLDLPENPSLRAGMFGRVELASGTRTSLSVPAAALIRRGQLEFVMVVDGDSARLRLVRAGRVRQNGVDVLSGLDDGERVVVSDAEKLSDGQPIEVLE